MVVQQSYAEWPAARSPGASVACLWASRPGSGASGLVTPDACLDIVWDGSSLMIAGPDTGPVVVPPEPGQWFAGLRFLPGRAPGLLGIPASELLDSRVPLEDVWGRAETAGLIDVLARAAGPEEAAHALDDAVAARATHALAADPIVDQLVSILSQGPDPRGVVQLASHVLSVGERRLHRHCRAGVGYGPKMLERVLRFQRARRLAGETRSLATVAVLAGYADQAHLTRECRRLAGLTPSDLFKTAPRAAA